LQNKGPGHPAFQAGQQGFMRLWSTCAPLAHSNPLSKAVADSVLNFQAALFFFYDYLAL
jgi:hypothetical protein